MKIVNDVKKLVLKSVANEAVKSTKHSVNTACLLWQYQPKETNKLKKMRKF